MSRSIPTTPADVLEKYSDNFAGGWDRPRHGEWSKGAWDPDMMEMRPATPVEIAEQALEAAARSCRVEELLDPIRALIDAKIMEALAAIRDGGAAHTRSCAGRCMMPDQKARQQTADIQRQRSTCRRATSGVLAASEGRTAVVMPNTLTLEL